MNDARIDHIEEALGSLGQKVDSLGAQLSESTDRLDGRIDALSVQLYESTDRLDGRIDELGNRVDGHIGELGNRLDLRIDALAAEVRDGFEQTQAGFDDHRRYAEFLWQGVRDDMSQRFNHVERRFDRVDERFDRLEQLIKER